MASAASGAPGAPKPPRDHHNKLDEALSETKKGWSKFSNNLGKSVKEMKNFTMTVDTKVDFITPTVESAKATSKHVWSQMSPDMQQRLVRGAPYAGVGFGSFAATRLYSLRSSRRREATLLEDLAVLKNTRDELLTDLKLSKTREIALETERAEVLNKLIEARAESAKPSPQMLHMSQYVTEATKAAAEAATAVVYATEACSRREHPNHTNSRVPHPTPPSAMLQPPPIHEFLLQPPPTAGYSP
mmetsp:Transcript_36054/g.60760  ORF Transcript_36054/g.60760 Transcript_36054/m.60760 type:complete len:244 (+) Transcript_36054:318-1049(+)|eukprot:CAMPEP_0198200872 /NCGR_PEP_ID=MMETSP1445-20131203/3775_1 /TAXON_ID=36898 /ORGANISM="Pyramimonas sp., Strain CCMP2087" /LENGTH=243 /DNA_ID=CAMNT_0043871035 /DNA_START=313 /DNA_END=1044 /DNA_ORIENTATION=+